MSTGAAIDEAVVLLIVTVADSPNHFVFVSLVLVPFDGPI